MRIYIGCDFAKNALIAASPRCVMCDSTGDVHGLNGEWRGRCPCPAGRALKPWTPTDIRRTEPPCDHSERIDVRFRDGAIHRGGSAGSWAWGEAGRSTIVYWRKSK